jgi:hypothetical protein
LNQYVQKLGPLAILCGSSRNLWPSLIRKHGSLKFRRGVSALIPWALPWPDKWVKPESDLNRQDPARPSRILYLACISDTHQAVRPYFCRVSLRVLSVAHADEQDRERRLPRGAPTRRHFTL